MCTEKSIDHNATYPLPSAETTIRKEQLLQVIRIWSKGLTILCNNTKQC